MTAGFVKAMMTATLLIVGTVATHAAPAKETRTMLSPEDVATIEAMVPAMAAAWRTHDAPAYAGQFVTDAEHINAYGMWWRGRHEIEQGIGFALTRIYADNPIVASDVTVSAVTPKVAILQYRSRLKPYSDPDGTRYADPQGRVTDVLVRTNDGWRIRNFQSTFINPKVPQPRSAT